MHSKFVDPGPIRGATLPTVISMYLVLHAAEKATNWETPAIQYRSALGPGMIALWLAAARAVISQIIKKTRLTSKNFALFLEVCVSPQTSPNL